MEHGEAARRPRVLRGALAERLSGFVYGTIVALAVIVAGARAYPDDAAHIAVLVGSTAVVFWLAHVYAHGLAHSVAHDERLTLGELRSIARREGAVIEAAVPLVGALLLGALGVISTRGAVWLAFALGLAVLVVEGVAVARVERLGRLGTLGIVAANLSFGVLLVGLKIFVSH